MEKKFGSFTLTDHFRTFHQQNEQKIDSYNFDSSTTIKQIPENTRNYRLDADDIEPLRRALKSSENEKSRNNKNKEK